MYSAAPSALTEQVLVPHSGRGNHAHGHSGLERGLDEMSLHSRGLNGTHYGDEYDHGLDEFREDEPPLGYGIEHACRWVPHVV